MDTSLYLELINAVWREIIGLKMKLFVLFVVLSFSVLTVGYFWPEKYHTSTTLYADMTNIIKPLLEGRAEVQELDPTKEAADIIYTRKLMMKVAEKAGLIDPLDPMEKQGAIVNSLRTQVVVESVGRNYFTIEYQNVNQDESFRVLNAVVDEFIKDSVDSRRSESRSAFEFIDEQVVSYKKQLLLAEKNLKDYKSKNMDGDEASVKKRINDLRLEIEEIKLTIGETQSKRSSLKQQLKNESKLQKSRGDLEQQQSRLENLRGQLDVYRMSYQDTYPDVITLKEQIAALELVIEAMADEGYFSASSSDSQDNPLYEELRRLLAEIEVDLESQRRRLASMETMLQTEYSRAERVASQEAEMSELVRDYDVTREIYEEMLARKEKARLSMTLDIEGQGMSFKIQEPAVYPLSPSGLRFTHFAMAGPFLSLAALLGLMISYVVLDPRVRSPTLMMQSLPKHIDLLAIIPHINSSVIERIQRTDMIVLIIGFLLFLSAYAGLAISRVNGVL